MARTILTVAAAALLAASLALPAAAGGNGAEHGGGNGGDHGGGAGGDHGNAAGSDHGGIAAAHGHSATAAAYGHGGAAADIRQAGSGQLAAALGALNAAHASPTALAHAAPGSRVGQIAAYDRSMIAALSMPDVTPAQIAARNAAIAAARAQLATASNRSLTVQVVARVDTLLGLPATDPTLGTTY